MFLTVPVIWYPYIYFFYLQEAVLTADVMSDTSPKADGDMSGGGRGTAETTRAPKQGRPNNKGRRAAGKKGHVPRFPELPPKYR